MFDVAVIGLGMIGSAALRYLSQPDTVLAIVNQLDGLVTRLETELAALDAAPERSGS